MTHEACQNELRLNERAQTCNEFMLRVYRTRFQDYGIDQADPQLKHFRGSESEQQWARRTTKLSVKDSIMLLLHDAHFAAAVLSRCTRWYLKSEGTREECGQFLTNTSHYFFDSIWQDEKMQNVTDTYFLKVFPLVLQEFSEQEAELKETATKFMLEGVLQKIHNQNYKRNMHRRKIEVPLYYCPERNQDSSLEISNTRFDYLFANP